MNTSCRDFLPAMLETAPVRPMPGSALETHLSGCESCRASFARMGRMIAALAALARKRAPGELDGRVVAATQAGQRQERALAHLRAALRHEAPANLDARVSSGAGELIGEVARLAAPNVLERLVREELHDPQHALTRRYVSRLERLGPPATLGERVQQAIGLPRRNLTRSALLGVAALLVLALSIWGWVGLERAVQRPRFQVVYVDDVKELDPLAREMLSGVTGGWSELQGQAR